MTRFCSRISTHNFKVKDVLFFHLAPIDFKEDSIREALFNWGIPHADVVTIVVAPLLRSTLKSTFL